MDCYKKDIARMCEQIKQSPWVEQEMKRDMNDDNVILHYYDRNRALKVYLDTIMGKATGTCEIESQLHIAKLLNDGVKETDLKLYKAWVYNSFVKSVIYHQYLLLRIDGKWYNESYANGVHKRIPQKIWAKHNKIKKLIRCPIVIKEL
jgi:hypothetical protein